MHRPRPILLLEDDIVDATAVERILKELNITSPLIHLNNGKEALEYLRNTNNQRPALVLLDLDMPEMNGLDFLKAIKADETLKELPVVVLTTSDDSQDKEESFNYIRTVQSIQTSPFRYRRLRYVTYVAFISATIWRVVGDWSL